jgi:hypothetical protein
MTGKYGLTLRHCPNQKAPTGYFSTFRGRLFIFNYLNCLIAASVNLFAELNVLEAEIQI